MSYDVSEFRTAETLQIFRGPNFANVRGTFSDECSDWDLFAAVSIIQIKDFRVPGSRIIPLIKFLRFPWNQARLCEMNSADRKSVV